MMDKHSVNETPIDELAKVKKSTTGPNRLRVFDLFIEADPRYRELSKMLGLTRNSLSHHWPQIPAYSALTTAKPNQINYRNAGLPNCLINGFCSCYATAVLLAKFGHPRRQLPTNGVNQTK